MKYACDAHGDWDANAESGCPRCVAEMRNEIKRLQRWIASGSVVCACGDVWPLTDMCERCQKCKLGCCMCDMEPAHP